LKNFHNKTFPIISNKNLEYKSGDVNINKDYINALLNNNLNKKIIFEEIEKINKDDSFKRCSSEESISDSESSERD
jgi:hypothetical protein